VQEYNKWSAEPNSCSFIAGDFLGSDREHRMKIETYTKGIFQIVRVKEDDDFISNLAELQDLIQGYLNRGKINIAISFMDASYIYSGAIRVIINCHRLIGEKGGELCIIEPNPRLLDILEILNINRVINILASEADLTD
jgi:anti-anti-sigma factor